MAGDVVRRPDSPRPSVPDDAAGAASSTWTRRWETSLTGEEHADLTGVLTRAFPRTAAFRTGRSWAGARPELRIVVVRDGQPVAHAALIRRFLRLPDDAVLLVGDVGLVAVDPDRQGLGLGGALMSAVATTLVDLELPYGFLTCGDDVRPFYRRFGWHPVEEPLRTIDIHHRVEDDRHSGMVLPALRSLVEWPRVPLVRDGQEI